MTDLQFAEEVLDQLQEKHPRFHGKSYLFLLSALHHVIQGLEEPRHISGQELANGVRRLALERYGPMARTAPSNSPLAARAPELEVEKEKLCEGAGG